MIAQWIINTVIRSIYALKRSMEPLNRIRPINRGMHIKVAGMELKVHPRHSRPKLYIQQYGTGNKTRRIYKRHHKAAMARQGKHISWRGSKAFQRKVQSL